MKRIVFMGTSSFAVPILKSISENAYEVSMVYTQPPKKSDRGQKIKKSPIQTICEELSLKVRTPNNFDNIEEEKSILKNLKPDLVLVVAYGQIIPKEMLGLYSDRFINIHASLLPKWRGAAPIQRSIMNLDKETGITIMKINEKLDQGDFCSQYKLKIENNENAKNLAQRLSNLAANKIIGDLDDILENKKLFIKQNNNEASYAKKISKTEGKINWDKSAEQIIANINGLYPNPGAWFYFKKNRYKILKAEVSNNNSIPGLVVNENLEISCGSNSIKIIKIQREGKKEQNIEDFILGTKIKKGVNLKDV